MAACLYALLLLRVRKFVSSGQRLGRAGDGDMWHGVHAREPEALMGRGRYSTAPSGRLSVWNCGSLSRKGKRPNTKGALRLVHRYTADEVNSDADVTVVVYTTCFVESMIASETNKQQRV